MNAIEEVNERFYSALEKSDLDEMSQIWLHEAWVKCVHPGWDLIIGWEKVRESFSSIFANPAGMRVSATQVEIMIDGDFAVVSCYENIVLFLDSTSAPVSARTTATNLYQRVEGNWRMIHHHASQIPNAPTITESSTIQ